MSSRIWKLCGFSGKTGLPDVLTINTRIKQEFPDENAAYEAKELKFTNAEVRQIIDFRVKYTASADNPV